MLRKTPSRDLTQVRAATAGNVLVAIALLLIWVLRTTVDRPMYVSELGADGEPTAGWFAFALLLVVLGGIAIAWAGRDIRSTAPLLRRWTPSVSLGVASAFFYLASRVPCTSGCPLPVGDTFTLQDLVHTSAAVVAFAAASVAMLQASFADGRRGLRHLSLAAGVLVALIAGTGGLLSLMRFGTDVGSVLELVATTIAIGWLIVYGSSIASRSVDRPHRSTAVQGRPAPEHGPALCR